jgi:hypothetical protein
MFNGLYKDDGILVFNNTKLTAEVCHSDCWPNSKTRLTA